MTDRSDDRRHWVQLNRAPVLTMWGAAVAERLGFDRDEALTLGRAVAGLNAYSKGTSLGLFEPTPEEVRKRRRRMRESDRKVLDVDLLGRAVPTRKTPDGLRALHDRSPIDPETVRRYLHGKFGDAHDDAFEAMRGLTRSMKPSELAGRAYDLYVEFRPKVPTGKKGWGAEGRLSLDRIRKMARNTASGSD